MCKKTPKNKSSSDDSVCALGLSMCISALGFGFFAREGLRVRYEGDKVGWSDADTQRTWEQGQKAHDNHAWQTNPEWD